MLLESGGQSDGIPHTVQAMISAQDRPAAGDRAHRAAAGRGRRTRVLVGCDRGARRQPDQGRRAPRPRRARLPRPRAALDDPRRGGVSLQARADSRRRLRGPVEVVPGAPAPSDGGMACRAGRSRTSSSRSGPTTSTWPPQLAEELEGAVPEELATEAADALEQAGRRALAREANNVARRLFSRAVELEPNLERRYLAAHAAWRMSDFPTVSAEMHEVSEAASSAGDHRVEVRALTALARVSLFRDADNACARELAGQGARRRRAGRRRRAVRRARGDRHGLVLGGRPRGGRAARERAARDRGADRARRPPERRAARAQRRLQRPARDGAGARAARARDRARRDEREPDHAGLDPARVRPPGRDRGPARRRRGRARGGARDLHRERRRA